MTLRALTFDIIGTISDAYAGLAQGVGLKLPRFGGLCRAVTNQANGAAAWC